MITVSIIIPCRNEEDFIAGCLDSILDNNRDLHSEMEILVVDGMSEDETRKIVSRYTEQYPFIRLVDNPRLIAAAALNIGIREARGDIIIRLDAHTVYSRDYIIKSMEYLKKYDAANVGGIIKTLPRNDTLIAKAIALSISHIFGVGRSFFRIGNKENRYADTVPFGCFRRDIFNKIGYFNEEQPRNEDIEFNARIRKAGEKILLSPEIVSYYYARGTLKEFWKHNFDNGYRVTNPLSSCMKFHSARHIAPLVAFTLLACLLILSFWNPSVWYLIVILFAAYLVANLFFSVRIAAHEKRLVYVFIMPAIFVFLHLGYAAGSMWGLITGIFSKEKQR